MLVILIFTFFWGGNNFALKTNFLANEFGDLLYIMDNLTPESREGYKKWKNPGGFSDPRYYNDPTGAGQLSFGHQYDFQKKYKKMAKQLPLKQVNKVKYYIHK